MPSAVMGEITSLTKNTKEFASLKTTVPMSFVRQWALTEKDKLYWEWKVVDGEMIAVVAKHESNTFTPDLKKERSSRRISNEELKAKKLKTGGKRQK
jgi:endonuclease/exonuclease/phosphatase (EEP) superfamily protein YafD